MVSSLKLHSLIFRYICNFIIICFVLSLVTINLSFSQVPFMVNPSGHVIFPSPCLMLSLICPSYILPSGHVIFPFPSFIFIIILGNCGVCIDVVSFTGIDFGRLLNTLCSTLTLFLENISLLLFASSCSLILFNSLFFSSCIFC